VRRSRNTYENGAPPPRRDLAAMRGKGVDLEAQRGRESRLRKPRGRPLEPSYETGKATSAAILSAAETVLVRYGHAGFTLKRVAEAAGIAVGNLNYHFPTKDSLLLRLVERTLAAFLRQFAALPPSGAETVAERLGDLVVWFMDDSTSVRYTHLFRELWAAALHSRALNSALRDFYDRSIAKVLALVQSFPTQMSDHDLKLIVYFMCIISEGCTVLFGARRSSPALFAQLKQLARTAVIGLATQSTSPTLEKKKRRK
jgi:AcrR family transcriptional regulator